MNYRHGYHAGNHTEVFKHSALVLLLNHLREKPKPFMVLDTHAGVGQYDLRSLEAQKTGEAADGIGAVLGELRGAALPYLRAVREHLRRGSYPGSPSIIAELLRDCDRLIACELHPEDARKLRVNFKHDRRVAVHHRDGYEAMLAFLPPPERRGLVFCDPPFEDRGEVSRLAAQLGAAARKWPTGIIAAWYPIKDDGIGRILGEALLEYDVQSCLRAEFLRYPIDGSRLAGSGMLFINPPWRFDAALRSLCDDLTTAFPPPRATSRVEWLREPA
jgi:23S rRNA (adenine2030-N6)-methyltransferase